MKLKYSFEECKYFFNFDIFTVINGSKILIIQNI